MKPLGDIPASFDVVVVGGGHAGIEASLAASRMGCSVALVTMDSKAIGRMSCNPAIGGTAKGHLVREIDALGGEMGKIADATGIHFRMLNKSKGPAVWSPRCQNDREMYGAVARERVLSQSGLTVIEGLLGDLIIQRGSVTGAQITGKGEVSCKAVVLCGGTFLNAMMHTGLVSTIGGRFGEPACFGLSEQLESLGFVRGRLKTGTPPRIEKSTIDFGETEEQPSDNPPSPFSFETESITNRQIPMFLTYTNSLTHDLLRLGFDESPMFTGRIKATGPRYCPSIEDKINRFADRDRHQIFLEPEGYTSDIVYVNGFSTSLPTGVQEQAIRTIPGLKRCRVLRFGYAVEYDFFPPHQLEHTLETKALKGLYLAGQLNGTSGYEEAAAQGLVAGISAALAVKGLDPMFFPRSDSYIGVLIDDLINKGTEEPYRIFTSRAEYRLRLRQDNADSRLMRLGKTLGLVNYPQIRRLNEKERRVNRAKQVLREVKVSHEDLARLLERGVAESSDSVTAEQLLKRPEVGLMDILKLETVRSVGEYGDLFEDPRVRERVEIEVKYDGYLKRQEEQIDQFRRYESMSIPTNFDFAGIKSLSSEAKEKFSKIMPRSVGQASRISGVTPADISVLMVHLRN